MKVFLLRLSQLFRIIFSFYHESIYRKQREYTRKTSVPSLSQYKLNPNKMQVEAIQSLQRLRENSEDKGLLISATGTGKTYLSAFELREYNPIRTFLFLLHSIYN